MIIAVYNLQWFNANSASFHLYHGENNLICNEVMMTDLGSITFKCNRLLYNYFAIFMITLQQDMTYTEKIRNDFVHLKTLAKHNSLWIAGDISLPDINISEYIILICWYDLRRMDRIVEPRFCANDNIDLS
jgi:hypothetical protein